MGVFCKFWETSLRIHFSEYLWETASLLAVRTVSQSMKSFGYRFSAWSIIIESLKLCCFYSLNLLHTLKSLPPYLKGMEFSKLAYRGYEKNCFKNEGDRFIGG